MVQDTENILLYQLSMQPWPQCCCIKAEVFYFGASIGTKQNCKNKDWFKTGFLKKPASSTEHLQYF